MATQRSIEVRVGIFVLVCLTLGAGLVWQFGKIGPQTSKHKTIMVTFDSVGGLIVDANVMYAGVNIGKVRAIKLVEDGRLRAQVTLGIDDTVAVRKDAKFVINQSGLLGDRYVDVIPGASTAEPLKEGEIIEGTHSVDLTEAIRNVVDVLQQAAGTINRVNGMLKRVDEMTLSTQNLQHVNNILADVDMTSSNAVAFTANLRGIVEESRASVSNTLGRIALAADNVNGTTRRLDDFVRNADTDARAAVKNLADSTRRLDQLVQRVEKSDGTIWKLLTDSTLHDELLRVTRNLEDFGLFYNTWLGPKVHRTSTNATGQVTHHPSTLEPPPGGTTPVPSRPAFKQSDDKPRETKP